MKKIIVYLLLALSIFLVACNNKSKAETTVSTTVETMTEAVAETTEEVITAPGLGDSDFDDEPEATKSSEPTKPAETTKPTTSSKPTETAQPSETSKPAETDQSSETSKPAETAPSKPAETTEPTGSAQPTETQPPENNESTEYEKFQNMNAQEQSSYMESFESVDEFFGWYNDAKAEYEAANPPIDVDGGSFDLGGL